MLCVNRRQKFLLAEIAAACALLAACGGGGDGAAEDPAAGAGTQTTIVAETGTSGAADAGATADTAASGDAAEVAPAPGEAAHGSLAAQSELLAATDSHLISDAGVPPPPSTDGQEIVAGEPDTSTPADGGLEQAAALTIASADRGFAKPKVAALDYTSSTSVDKQHLLAKFKVVVLGGRSGANLKAFTSGIKAEADRLWNNNIKIGYYVAFNEMPCTTSASNHYHSAVQAANTAGWWLRKADGSRSQWTSTYNNCDMNISQWGKRDSSGRTWAQYKARFDYNEVFRDAPLISFAFSDNTFDKPRVDADWKRIGTNQKKTDATIISAQRAGHAAYWSALKAVKPGLLVLGNADNGLSAVEYREKLNGSMQEAAMGRNWSLETWAGWVPMMDRYKAQLRNTASPNYVFMEVRGNPSDYKTMRYGLASAMMADGYFMFLPSTGGFKPAWYDEYSAPIGKPVQASPTAPKQNGIWMRKYENGLVLVNPSKTKTASINVGSGYYRLKGTQNPTVNNGQAQSTVTLGPRQGLLMLKR